MQCLFDTPQFPLIPAAGRMDYAIVSNLLEVSRGSNRLQVPIEVNTSLFSIMARLGVGKDSKVSLYLDYNHHQWIFGIFVDEQELYDLWVVPVKKLPSWIDFDSL